ncbi:eukaryotic release factor 1-2 [Striga asiatica]|uniref:Eukaryotic release factor 1-2 n=1 Tax=Striga asiatica TaxID=4170 RepID=A0A5A7NY96_STRAF|nr:eukaryotic release factor 1-2 [Striga asiatica]
MSFSFVVHEPKKHGRSGSSRTEIQPLQCNSRLRPPAEALFPMPQRAFYPPEAVGGKTWPCKLSVKALKIQLPKWGSADHHRYHARSRCGISEGTEPKLFHERFWGRDKSTWHGEQMMDPHSTCHSPVPKSMEHC